MMDSIKSTSLLKQSSRTLSSSRTFSRSSSNDAPSMLCSQPIPPPLTSRRLESSPSARIESLDWWVAGAQNAVCVAVRDHTEWSSHLCLLASVCLFCVPQHYFSPAHVMPLLEI